MEPVIRNLRFEIDRDVPVPVPVHWHGGRQSISIFFDNLSVFFPVGERFFMATVRGHRAHVKDEALQREVRAFCGQEAVHGREHDRYNDMLRRSGYPVDAMEQRVVSLLRVVTRAVPKRMQLAVTCALEHMTALMAHMVLGDARVLEGAHPEMAALWRWHAAEENEHKAVAYDVFLAAGGTYVERVVVMAAASAIFWAKVLEQQLRMMRADGSLLSLAEWRALGRFLFVDPGAIRGVARRYLAYYRPGFHPRDIESEPLIEAWKQELARSAIYARAAA